MLERETENTIAQRLRKYYIKCHCANIMLLWKYYEYVSTNVFKIAI